MARLIRTAASAPAATERTHAEKAARRGARGLARAGTASAASAPKESSLGTVVEANKYDAAVEALEFDEAMASPVHGQETEETTPSKDKLTLPKDREQSNKKPDAIETRFRLADSNKDGVQDLAEFRWLGDVEELVRKLFQHYDQVL